MTLGTVGLTALRMLGAETAHALALAALRFGLASVPERFQSPRLAVDLCGLCLPNPLGLAAGADKNAVALDSLLGAGFGFVEVGTVTPRAQKGNPWPRHFALDEDRAAINRLGFPGKGAAAVAARISGRRAQGIVGANIGANRDSPDPAGDYARLIAELGGLVDFVTVNVSSPNTEGLRALQARKALDSLLAGVREARDASGASPRLFLKISPDLEPAQLGDVAEVAIAHGVDAVVATNTTVSRPPLLSRHARQSGGLSGKPLYALSTRILRDFHRASEGRIPLIGVGGVASAADAYGKIKAGASAVQLYTALAFGGLALVPNILSGLDRLLERDGFASVGAAVGADA